MTETFAAKVARGAVAPFTEVMTINPALANEMLDTNRGNRKPRPAKIRQLVSDIANGRFAFNGETIVISDTGELNDGQHRLMAVTQAGTSIVSNVSFGVKRDTRLTVDQGISRNAGGAITILGNNYGNEMAAVTRMLIAYERSAGKGFGGINHISSADIVERATTDPMMRTAIEWAAEVPAVVRPATFGVVALWRYLAGTNQAAIDFVNAVAYGDNLSRDSVAYLVRMRLGRESRVAKMATEIYLRGLVYHLKGESFSRVRLIGEFPSVKG